MSHEDLRSVENKGGILITGGILMNNSTDSFLAPQARFCFVFTLVFHDFLAIFGQHFGRCAADFDNFS